MHAQLKLHLFLAASPRPANSTLVLPPGHMKMVDKWINKWHKMA